MAIAALAQILAWEVPRIAATLAQSTAAVAERCAALGLSVAPAAGRGPHMLGAALPAGALSSILPALQEAGCHAAVRGVSLRIALHLHITGADVDRLGEALGRATALA